MFAKLFFVFYYRMRNAVLGIPDVKKTAQQLAQEASKQAFRVYRDPVFRKGVSFDTTETVEQDRMFNELVVTNLVLEILMIETLATFARGRSKEWLRAVAEAIPTEFITTLRDASVAEEFLEIWKKLIALRQDEYEQTRLDHREYFPELGEGNPWVRVTAISCLFHIRRSKNVPNDPLLPLVMTQALNIADHTRRAMQPTIFGP